MNDVIEPRSLALHKPGWEAQEVRGLLDFAECTYRCQGDNAGQAEPRTCPASLRRGNTAGQTAVDKEEDGESARDRHHLEVLDVEVACKRAVGGPCQETYGRVAEARRPSRVYVRKKVAEKPEQSDCRQRGRQQEAPGQARITGAYRIGLDISVPQSPGSHFRTSRDSSVARRAGDECFTWKWYRVQVRANGPNSADRTRGHRGPGSAGMRC